jgi:hypothetical protein
MGGDAGDGAISPYHGYAYAQGSIFSGSTHAASSAVVDIQQPPPTASRVFRYLRALLSAVYADVLLAPAASAANMSRAQAEQRALGAAADGLLLHFAEVCENFWLGIFYFSIIHLL